MSIISKTCFAVLSLALCGLTLHHVAHDVESAARSEISVWSPRFAATTLHPVDKANGSLTAVRLETVKFNEFREHLNSARAAAELMPGYTAILEMQEEVDGTLRPLDRIEFKFRREPFSVYMRWNDSGQEALYVHGENDNRLIVKPTKGLAAIRSVWRLDPDSRMAKQNCRYPITDAGIENLVTRIEEFYSGRDVIHSLASCKSSESRFANREVELFQVEFKDEKSAPDYRASTFVFDKHTKLLIAVDNFGWSDDQSPRLVEHYFYDQITVIPKPDDRDFAQENPAYAFEGR